MKPPPSATRADSFPVVGVGASAGGLDAFTRFLRHLPADPGLAILLVQHLDPSRPSLLTEILSRATTLPVHEAADGMPVEVDHVYVIPPDTRMSVAGGAIRLQPRGDPVPHHPVDFLFQSLAEAFGPRAVAVVLSGGGTDGTLGLGAVREAGGTTFAQDEGSSGQTGMPASAVASGNVDVVLTPEGIADALIQLVQRPDLYRPAVPGVTEPPEGGEALAPLFALIRARTGIDFEQYKQNTIRRRVSRRLALRTLATVVDLVRVAQDDPAELNALTRDLLIGVTRFFREPDTFDRFRQSAIPTLLRNRMPGTPLRVWVPGCSTGEEAYSLAIVLLEDLGDVEEVPVKILATDVNEQALALARTGVYPKNISADVSPHRLRRYFLEMSGGYRIRPSVRDLVVFARHDLTTDPPFARMDLISCRNVLIYFDTPLQRRVVPLFHYALRPGGFLLLGSSETIGLFPELFVPADPTARLYTRTLAPGRVPTNPAVGAPSWGRPSAVASPSGSPRDPGGLADVQREADRLLARYAPAGILVDANLNILQFRGDTDPYLRHPPGTAGLDFLRMARAGLLPDLRDGIEAARTGGAVRRPGVRVGEGEGARRVTLLITPLAGGGPGLLCFLIVFEDEAATPTPPLPPIPVDADLAEQVTRLERELDSCREHQQAVVEEYEAANEELKSANEEILASNEELQSANEELQQTKEEMQSANEELETVNEELGQRNRELGRVNDDLNSLLLGVNVPVVIVGRDLRLRRVTSQAEEAFGLLPADAGRSLREVRLETVLADRGPPQRLDLEGTVARVISTLEAATFEAQDRHGRWYAVRVRPYETGDNRIDGAVITAMDIDAMKRAEAARHDLEAKMFQTQKLESLGVLAGGVAHDLNNLLTPVIGYADLARDALPAGSPARAFLEEVAQHTREATAVVQQLLVYAGRSQRDVGIRDLSQLVRNLDKLLERAAASSSSLQTGVPEYLHTRPPLWGAELRFELTATPLPVEVDATQVAQVVLNLVTNGAEAMLQRTKSAGLLHDTLPERTAEGGRGVVTIRTTALQADRAALSSPYLETNDLAEGAYAVLEVSDTGAGMDAATLARMFDPFFTTKFTGRGLGLAAVLGIVRSHRGTLTVRSEPGRGTTVRVLLPLLDRLVPAPPVAEGVPLADWRGSGTVLLVDDERSVRGLTSVILHRAGFVVLEAADGNEGLALFHAHANEVRVVVTDLTMPGMDGLALAAALRAERPTLPILVMSGYGDEAIPGSPSDQQVSGFLQKPFVPGSLLEALRNVLADS